MSRLRRVSLLLLGIAALQLRSQGQAKLDADLGEIAGRAPIFVRMADQVFRRGGDYEAFCREHARTPRSRLRAQTLARLLQSSEQSWTAVSDRVERLTAAGGLRDVRRFWVVNGFAGDATAAACRELASWPEVAFVYRQRQPGLAQHHTSQRGDAWRARRRGDLERALAMQSVDEPAFDQDGLRVPWNLARIRADVAWRSGAHGQGVVIALCDSGLLVTPPLASALWCNRGETLNGEDDDGNGHVDDLFGWDCDGDTPFAVGDGPNSHGSMCAGILAGRPWGEPRTVTGVAPRARLMVLQGTGRLQAYEYAIQNHADVFSMSYMWINVELGHYRGLFRTAHEHMAACGVVAVGGAGNFRKTAPAGRQIALPKDIPCVITAAGIREDGTQAGPSSEGPCTWDGVAFYDDFPPARPLRKPDVTGVFGGYPVWHHTELRGRKLQVDQVGDDGIGLVRGPQGNSFSGPHAGGVVALMLSVQRELTPWRIKGLLEATCEDLGDEGPDNVYGAGLLQADAAVAAARAAIIDD